MLKNIYIVLVLVFTTTPFSLLKALQQTGSLQKKAPAANPVRQRAASAPTSRKTTPQAAPRSLARAVPQRSTQRIQKKKNTNSAKKTSQTPERSSTRTVTKKIIATSEGSHPLLKTALLVAAQKKRTAHTKKEAPRRQPQPAPRKITRPVVRHRRQPVTGSATPIRGATRQLGAPTRSVKSAQAKAPQKKKSSSDFLKVPTDTSTKNQAEALFIWPIKLDEFWISSFFGPRKKPNGVWGFHSGLDLAACRGTPVYAAGEAVVAEATHMSGYGNYILLVHNEEYKTRYAHLDKILVKRGQKVLCGDLIGKVGATGNVRKSSKNGSGAHLHFEVYKQNKRVNPLYFLA